MALNQRYQAAMADAAARGCDAVATALEAVAARTKAVLSCGWGKIAPLLLGSSQLVAGFHDLAGLRFRLEPLPDGERDWDLIRQVAEVALFGDRNKRHIHYAALSVDGTGLASYGECWIELVEDLIAHRTSVFEENSLVFLDRHNVRMFDADRIPFGFRSDWSRRGRLCVAKLAWRLQPDTKPTEFDTMLLKSAPQRIEDNFVEVHIFGPLTKQAFARIIWSPAKPRERRRKFELDKTTRAALAASRIPWELR